MSKNEFDGIKFDESKVDTGLYVEGGTLYPSVAWVGMGAKGKWLIDIDAIEGEPKPYWTASEHQFGRDPNAPTTPVWEAERFRFVPIGIRRRDIVIDAVDVEHYYPHMTAKAKRVEGTFKSHTQILALVDGIDAVVISLLGMTKTVSWDNPESGQYRKQDFPTGAGHQLIAYAKRASKQVGVSIPWLCAWVVDLVPLIKDGKPHFVPAGPIFMNPFVIDMRTGGDFPKTRYVGQDTFEINQALRRELALPWEAEWESAESMTPEEPEQEAWNPSDDPEDIPF